ncbi:hypothetical protein VTH8203_03539 [Vibrio thalassae]|uniref:Uncharacterized protein n=1 Tax=Vibrio thalassae TaxID=1243014 RepID=A0A240EN25_9VIBR|nr:hypothetical protein [Vibrio thalassae]SNX49891.1 hypothetical protein VTH8203_03539 [Vibrio thalassae]
MTFNKHYAFSPEEIGEALEVTNESTVEELERIELVKATQEAGGFESQR